MENEASCKDISNNALNLQKISKDLEAEKLYEIILQRQNCNFKTESLNNLGIIYKKRGLLDKAKRFFIDATLENTKFWEGYLNLGDCFIFQHKACSRPPLPKTRIFKKIPFTLLI